MTRAEAAEVLASTQIGVMVSASLLAIVASSRFWSRRSQPWGVGRREVPTRRFASFERPLGGLHQRVQGVRDGSAHRIWNWRVRLVADPLGNHERENHLVSARREQLPAASASYAGP